jgi:hypothetical protein
LHHRFGIIESTPRDGSRAKPFQQDTSVIRDREIASGKTGVCGRTSAGGNNDVAAQLAGLFWFHRYSNYLLIRVLL